MNAIAKRKDGTEVKAGDEIISFRDEPWTFLSVTRSSRIYAQQVGKEWRQEFFPSVFDLEIWVEKEAAK